MADERAEVGGLGVEHGGTGVVAADLEQVGEQPLEPVELGAQQLGGARDVRREVLAGLVQHVGGHLHGGQRRPQLVGDVGGEPLLQLGEPLELGDLPLEAVGHRVEAGGQAGELVLAAHGHAFLELPLGETLGGAGRLPHRVDDEPGDQHADAHHEQGEGHADDHDGAADQGEALLLLVEREGEVELDLLAARLVGGHGGADEQRGLRVALVVGHQRVLVRLVAVGDVGPQVGGQRVGDVRAADGGRLAGAGAVDHDDVEVTGRPAALEQLAHRALERGAHARRVAGGDAGHLALREEDTLLGLVDRGLNPALVLQGPSPWLPALGLTLLIGIGTLFICGGIQGYQSGIGDLRRAGVLEWPLRACCWSSAAWCWRRPVAASFRYPMADDIARPRDPGADAADRPAVVARGKLPEPAQAPAGPERVRQAGAPLAWASAPRT